jgi:hypothetical protein
MPRAFRLAAPFALLCAGCSAPPAPPPPAPEPAPAAQPAAAVSFLAYRPDDYPADSGAGDSLIAPGAMERWPLAADHTPPPLTGERWLSPLLLGDAELLLFDRDVQRIDLRQGRHIDYRLQPSADDSSAGRLPRAAAATADGLWLVGERAQLYDRQGKPLADFAMGAHARQATRLIALADGSVLVFGTDADGAHANRVSRIGRETALPLAAANGGYALHALPEVPDGGTSDYALALLADGRVMLSGGRVAVANGLPKPSGASYLFDPRAQSWQRIADMANAHARHALIALADGGAVAVGGDNERVERWNAQSGQWSALPDLPMPMRALYNLSGCCTRPGGGVLADGTLVVAGSFHPWVLALKPGETRWRAVADIGTPRPGAFVQVRGEDTVAISGGASYDGRYAGVTIVRLALHDDLPGYGVAWSMQDAAIARRGDRVFAAGGWQPYVDGHEQPQYSAMAELVGVDGRHAGMPAIAPLPQPAGLAQGFWLDDDRLVVKSVAVADDERVHQHIDVAYTTPNPAVFASYSLREGRWHTLAADPRLDDAYLVGHVGDAGYLIGRDAHVFKVDLVGGAVIELPRLARERERFVARVFADGRIVVAGGQAQQALISLFDPSCPDCADRLIGFGPKDRPDVAEIFDPAAAEWHETTASTHRAQTAAILADGRVAQFGGQFDANGQCTSVAFERSSADGTSWQKLPLPENFQIGALATSRLLTPQDDGSPLANALFLLVHEPGVSERYTVWRYLDEGSRWSEVGHWNDAEALQRSIALTPIGNEPRYRIAGLLHGQVIAWSPDAPAPKR